MKILTCVFLLAAGALPPAAFAQTPTEVTTRGVVITAGDQKFEANFTPDGKFVLASVIDEGVWRIEGDKLCTKSSNTLIETCTAYPPNKKSGDKFELDGASGQVTVQIR